MCSKSTPNAGAPLSSAVSAPNRAAGMTLSRTLCTSALACGVPASRCPAKRIWKTWPVRSTRLARSSCARTAGGGVPALDTTRAGASTVPAWTSRCRRTAATNRCCAATACGVYAPPAWPVSTTSWLGASEPGPSVSSSSFRPKAASVLIGVPRLSPPVSASSVAGSARAIITAAEATNTGIGRRMIPRASQVQNPCCVASARRWSTERGTKRRRLTFRPMTARSAGSSVAEAAIETSGTSRPPMPIERMKGSGMSTSSARPTATVAPENRVARPAVTMVVRSASSASSWRSSSSRKRKTTSIE